MRPVTADVGRAFQNLKDAFRDIGRALVESARQMSRTMRAFTRIIREAANDEVHVCGLEARYLVRGGLGCYTYEDLHALVRGLLYEPWEHAPEDERVLMHLLTRHNRARLAAAAIRGYAGQ